MNKVILMGNLTRNPELRYTPSGTAVCDFGLAINEHYTNKDGKPVDSTVFVEVECWGKQAENCNSYIFKGAAVLVDGRLKFEQWEKDGKTYSKLKVRGDRVQFLTKKDKAPAGLNPDGEAGHEVNHALDDAHDDDLF